MRGIVLDAPGQVRVAELPEPQPGPAEALVSLRLGGLCGSDVAALRGSSPHLRYPCVLGHELLVDVVHCPERPDLVGRRAVVEPLLPCGACPTCRVGRYNCCPELRVLGVHAPGGLTEHAALPARNLYAVPEGMPDELAVLAEPLSIAYRAVQRSGVEAGRVVVVLGAGPIGLLITQLLLGSRGCRVLISDVDPQRLAVAQRLGAEPLPPSSLEGAAGVGDVVFEAAGHPAATAACTDLVAPTGRIVLVGWNRGPVPVDTVTLMRKEAEIFTSRNSVGAFGPVLRLLASGAVDPKSLISHRFPLTRGPEALRLLANGGPAVKVLVAGPA